MNIIPVRTQLACCLTLAWLLILTSSVQAEPFHVPKGQRQLFLDDVGIARLDNLARRMHQPDKKGAVIRIDPGVNGLEQHSLLPGPVIYDPDQKVYKCWCTVPKDAFPATGYWESPDGLHWTKPTIGMVEYKGSRENNYVTIDLGGDTGRFTPSSVIYDPHDPDPSGRYKCALPPYGFGISPDGIRWTGLKIHVKNEDSFSFSYDPIDRLFILAMREGGLSDRRVTLSTSRDFENWTEPELIFRADELDQKMAHEAIAHRFANPTLQAPEFHVPSTVNAQIYAMKIVRYEGLYIGLPMVFYRSGHVPANWEGFKDLTLHPEVRDLITRSGDWTGLHVIQLMCSRDLRKWKRLGERKPFINPSHIGSGAYDTLGMTSPGSIVERDDELWLYYGGLRTYANVSLGNNDQGAACLAVLRRDGFISLDAGESAGTLDTEPFTMPAARLMVNLDAAHGELLVELFDDSGERLAKSKPIKGDLPRGELQWSAGDLAQLVGQTISLRFTLRDGSIYSYWFE